MRQIQHPKLTQVKFTDVMHALSDPVRIEIVRNLAMGGDKCCSELLGKRPKSSMSHHFKILRAAGLIESRAEGKEHRNTLRREDLEKRFPGLLDSVLRAIR